MALFQIGPFEFINLSRPPSLPKLQTAREVRPGVEGVTFWGTGRRSEQFGLASSCDTQNVLVAVSVLKDYEALVGTGPVPLVWAGALHSMVFVHDVVPIEDGIHQNLLAIGGTLGTSKGMIRCAWLLENVPVQQQQQQQQ